MRAATPVDLSSDERATLEAVLGDARRPKRDRLRAEALLRASCGWGTKEIAAHLGVAVGTVSRWRNGKRTCRSRPRGRPQAISERERVRILAMACEPPPTGSPLDGWTFTQLFRRLSTGAEPPPSRSSAHRLWQSYDHPIVAIMRAALRRLGPYRRLVVFTKKRHFYIARRDQGRLKLLLCVSPIGPLRFALSLRTAGAWTFTPIAGVLSQVLREAVRDYGDMLVGVAPSVSR